MTPQVLIETLRQRVLLADGAMGTRLMSHELHERPECSDKTATHDHGLTAGNTAGDRAEARESGNVEQRRTVDESVRVPEQWLLRFPERIGQIHRSYVGQEATSSARPRSVRIARESQRGGTLLKSTKFTELPYDWRKKPPSARCW